MYIRFHSIILIGRTPLGEATALPANAKMTNRATAQRTY